MIQASASFTAQDVSTQCRVRRSPYASTPQFEEAMDMKATIRHWQPKRYYGFVNSDNKHLKQGLKALRMVQDDINGPELVLTSIHQWPEEPASPSGMIERNSNSFEGRDRFESFGSMKQQRKLLLKKKAIGNSTVAEEETKTSKPQQLLPQLPPIVIPLADIVVVDVYHGNTKHMNLTTKSCGFFELRFETHNSYDVMLACLAATLPENRIFGMIEKTHSKPSAAQASFDVDTLTATRIAERMQRETFGEKLRRRLRRLCLNMEEMSSTIAENCGCGNDQHLDSTRDQIRDSAPPLNIFPCTLEMDDEVSTFPDGANGSHQKLTLLPSGLSVESADPSVAVWDDSKKKTATTNGSSNPLPKLAETDGEPSPTGVIDSEEKNTSMSRHNGSSSLMVESPA